MVNIGCASPPLACRSLVNSSEVNCGPLSDTLILMLQKDVEEQPWYSSQLWTLSYRAPHPTRNGLPPTIGTFNPWMGQQSLVHTLPGFVRPHPWVKRSSSWCLFNTETSSTGLGLLLKSKSSPGHQRWLRARYFILVQATKDDYGHAISF